MSNSKLVSVVSISPHKNSPRTMPIDRITIHCVVGQCTAEQIGAIFKIPSKQASCNYGVDKDGRIVLVVDENDRSWCSSSGANDHRAITIEVSSDTQPPYSVTDAALKSTINLCEDICKRYNKTKLLWFGDKDKTLSYQPKKDEMVLTVHRWFANKSCPGEYLYSRQGMIADEVTKRLNQMEGATLTYEQWLEYMNKYRKNLQDNDKSEWSEKAREWCVQNKIFTSAGLGPDGQLNYMWQDLLTREQAATLIYRYAQLSGLA